MSSDVWVVIGLVVFILAALGLLWLLGYVFKLVDEYKGAIIQRRGLGRDRGDMRPSDSIYIPPDYI